MGTEWRPLQGFVHTHALILTADNVHLFDVVPCAVLVGLGHDTAGLDGEAVLPIALEIHYRGHLGVRSATLSEIKTAT